MQYFDDSDDTQSGGSGEGKDTQDATDSGGKTALIDSSICPDMPVGSTIELTIKKVLDSGEYLVEYGKPSGESEAPPEESAPQQSEMAGYME